MTIPALAASPAEGLELVAESVAGGPGRGADMLRLSVDGGAAVVDLSAGERFLFIEHGTARLRSEDDAAGRRFVDAVARWLELELDDETAPPSPEADVTCDWVLLGEGRDATGFAWRAAYKLCLARGDRTAEVFLRVSTDGARAQLLEKARFYRKDLVDLLERALVSPPWRTSRPLRRAAASANVDGGRTLCIDGTIRVEVPDGWSIATAPDAKHRLTDAGGERSIELWHVPLPVPLPNAEDLLPRLRMIIEESGYRELAKPVDTFVRRGAAFAWTEIASDHRDRARATSRGKPFRVRVLAAGAGSSIVMVTGKWPAANARAAEGAWTRVIDSLRFG
jgi:hypothetical protein